MSRPLYLGRDAATGERIELEPDIFTTHGVLLGMTGSGKTGLALTLLEEMVEAGIPIIAIDPKGDLANLALLFPELSAADFAAWTDAHEAQRAQLSVEALAAQKAESWKSGLAEWELNALHLARLKNKLDLRVFTPGSTVARAVNLLGDFEPPAAELDIQTRTELATSIVSGLLSLVEKDIDALRDPRHVLLVNILSFTWDKGVTLSLEDLITYLVDPPFAKVGVFPVDSFLSPDQRMKLALQLNNLVASPAFAAWKQGEALDIGRLMEATPGRTPVNLFYLSHLEEKERQFFVGQLMNAILSWSRGLPGSSSLRALVYFDEVSGYLPPYPASPPSKSPILTLLKQSRAVGLGLCLATQNPVDLDYKALSNIGTTMIGRLPTQQDQQRVRDGLISAGAGLSANELDAEFSKLKPRSFLLKTPKSQRPSVLRTRQAMSYLRGPVTLKELKELPLSEPATAGPAARSEATVVASPATPERATPPPVPKGFSQTFVDPRYVFGTHHGGFFEPHRGPARADSTVLFEPALRASLKLAFSDSKESFLWHQLHHYLAFPLGEARQASELFTNVALQTDYLLSQPPDNARFTNLPEAFDQGEELAAAQKGLVDHLYRTLTATRFVNKHVKLYSRPEEPEERFLARCRQAADDLEDEAALKLRQKLKSKLDRLDAQMTKAKAKVERLSQSEKGKKIEGLWNAGEMLLSIFSKKKKSFSSVLNKSRQAAEASTKTSQAEEELAALQQEVLNLQQEMENALADLNAEYADKAEAIETTEIRLAKKDITVDTFELMWVPTSSRL